MTKKRIILLALLNIFILGGAGAQSAPHYPFPRHKVYAKGAIRPNHRTQAQLDADVLAFYNTWKTHYLLPAGHTADGRPMMRVSYGSANPKRTVSEGQGYGMVIVATMAGADPQARELFDGLYLFAKAHPSHIENRLMAWEVPGAEQTDSAFDGDADIAYGLMLAHAQWGSEGPVNYAAAATDRIEGILVSAIGSRSRLPLLGDWVDGTEKKHNQFTPRSSDLMPGHFRAYGRFTKTAEWETVARHCTKIITALQKNHSPTTGLLPDFIVDADTSPKPAPPDFLEKKRDGDFFYNAGRAPWRIGTDALLNNNAASAAQVKKVSAWIEKKTGGNPEKIHAGYALSGNPLPGQDYFSTLFVAPFGVAAMLDPTQQNWLNALYDSLRKTHQDYYEDSVTLLCMLVMSGNFWDPTVL